MIRREDNGKSLRKVLVFFIIIVTIASIGAVGHFPNEKGSDIQLIDNLKHVEPCLTEPGLISIIPTSDKSSETYIMPPAYGQSFQNVNTSRCVLNELYACLSNASFLPSWLGAYDTLNGEYERDEAFFIQWHCNVDSILIPPGMGLTDPYDTGPNLFGPPWSDSLVRIFQSTPYGLSTPMYMFPVPSGPYAGTTIPIPMQWTDGTYLYEDPPVYYVADADEDFLLRTNDIRTLVETRRISETPVTIAINGTYDPVTTWGNISATLCAIGDLPTNELMVDFFLVENFGGIIEQWTTPAPPDWNLHTLNYTMNFIGRQWVGIAEPNSVGPWSFYNKTDTISYQNVSFWDLNNHSWNENQLWVLCSIRDMNTMNIIQTSAFNISASQPDLFITPQDVGLKNYGEVVNETVYGPTVNGETGPIYLNHGDIINCTLYIDLAGTEWLQLEEPADYTLNYTTGEIDTSTIEPYDDGWVFHAFYNHSAPFSSGEIAIFDITVRNAGNGAAAASTLHITDGDGGPLIDTVSVPALAPRDSVTVQWDWNTTGWGGYHTLCLIADGPNLISESDDNNNIAPFDIFVTPLDDVGVISIDSFIDGGSYECDTYDILATVHNFGSNPQTPFDVHCQIRHVDTTYILDDDCEGGNLGWTADANWGLRTLGAHSPITSWDFGNGDYPDPSNDKLTFGPFDLSTASTATWTWFHDYDFEGGWDGGVVEASADGAIWDRLTPANGYDGPLAPGIGNPLEGQTTYTGASGGFVQDLCGLSAYLGDPDVWIRYWAGCDNWDSGEWGWRIDDIQLHMQSFTVLYSNVTQTTQILDQFETEQLNWTYEFNSEGQFEISVMSMLPSDIIDENNESVVTITTFISPTFDIPIGGMGWQFISFPIEAVGNVSQVFDDSTHGDGGTAWDVIRWYDNFNKEWKEFATFKPSSLNDIDVVDNKFGFWINITSNTGDYMLTVGTGHSPIASVNINLFLGWNLVGYPSATARFGSDTLPPEADLVSYFDPGQPYLIHDEIPGSVTLLEGNAYWVHVVADTVWVVDL